jgi:hypothetical protein
MDDANKLLGYLVILAAIVALAVLVIDFKIKNDLIQTAIKIDGDLRKIQVFTGTAVPNEAASKNGSDSVSSWAGHLRGGDLVDQSPVVATTGRFAAPEPEGIDATEAAESAEPSAGNADTGIPAED